MMTRREFIASLGLAAGAVAFVSAGGELPVAETAALRVGDCFTIAGRYAVHPVTRHATKQLQWFMVTAIDGDTISLTPR